MIRSFADDATEDIFNGINSKQARKRLCPLLHAAAYRKLDMLNAAHNLHDLKVPPSNRLEMLKDDLRGKHSIRINDQYRIVFRWTNEGPEEVIIMDYH